MVLGLRPRRQASPLCGPLGMTGRDTLHRTAKALVDGGKCASFDDALSVLQSLRLQIDAGPEIASNASLRAGFLTAINAAARAFLGGVDVRLAENVSLPGPWSAGWASDTVQSLGGRVVRRLKSDIPTIRIGNAPGASRGSVVVRATCSGWIAAVVEGAETPLAETQQFTPAGIASAGMAVGEIFQRVTGDNRAGRRNQGLSLWRPDRSWLDPDAQGPDASYAPDSWWLIGLGQLGQAYAWTISLLPYAKPDVVSFVLQDFDRITEANRSTGLLTREGNVGERKTRLVAAQLDHLGHQTAIVERRFTGPLIIVDDEPKLVLFGVDRPEPRHAISQAGADLVIDIGLGGGARDFLDMSLHVFPGSRTSSDVRSWRGPRPDPASHLLENPAYQALLESGDRCGVVDVAGIAVAASFVGAAAAPVAIAESVRRLMEGPAYEVADLSLRDVEARATVSAVDPPSVRRIGFADLAV
jgi:hypothetical protein